MTQNRTMTDIWTYRDHESWANTDIVGYKVEAIDGEIGSIDQATVEMAGARPVSMNGRRVDTNLDRYPDVEYRFQIGKLALTDTTTSICLTGKTRNGDLFRGCGEVVVVPE